jgi:phosphoribosylanthranilate isomerase
MSTRVKICGITRPHDAALAAELGADFLGVNFFKGPRRISFETATTLVTAVTPLKSSVQWVGLVGDAELPARSAPEIQGMRTFMDACAYFQHYDTPAQLADAFQRLGASSSHFKKLWLVHHVQSPDAFPALSATLASLPFVPAALLLDTASPSGQLGGTGQSFNWDWIADARAAGELEGLPPIILAGGLTPDNVADAIRIARPYAVDVASGVEVPGKPGIKDPARMRDFIQAAKAAR